MPVRKIGLLLLCALASIPLAGFAQNSTAPARQDCTPSAELHFLCDAEKPEDLARIPATRWMVASGFSAGSGLKLVDLKRRTMRRWYLGGADQLRPDLKNYPDCLTAPEPGLFNARGISLRMTNKRRGVLHVINHGGRESVEVFEVALHGKAPELRWLGCLLMPAGHVGNDVATYSDGTVLATVLTRPGTTITDFEMGRKTGGVFERAPGDAFFKVIPGSELPGNNGLETARDDSGFYTVAFGLRSVVFFDRGAADGPRAIAKAPGFMPDNVQWDGKRLIAAGMVADEPRCGGVRQIIEGVADRMLCHRGYVVAALDPLNLQWTVLARGDANAKHNGVSSAVLYRRDLWLGSYQADRLAWRRLRK
jgi:hypothetical protein